MNFRFHKYLLALFLLVASASVFAQILDPISGASPRKKPVNKNMT